MKAKILGILAVFLFALLSLNTADAASPYYGISKVEVENKEVSTTDTSYIVVERGQDIQIDVWINGKTTAPATSIDNVRVKAWIGGYEYGDVAEKTSVFKIEKDGVYHKTLSLVIPNDIDADNSGNSEQYTLNIEVYDQNDNERLNYKLKIGEKRHDLRVVDTILRPGYSVTAGERLFATVRVENMGDKIEKDVQVKASIPELGLEARDYIDELIPEYSDDDDDERTSDDVDLFLAIPTSARTGDYKLVVDVIYSNGHEKINEEYLMHIEGVKEVSQEEALISVDGIEKQVNAGGEVIYKIMFANFGEAKKTYSAEVVGVGIWGSALVDPAFVRLGAGETGELYIKVIPNQDTSGKHPFTVKIRESGNVVKEVNLNANVVAKSAAAETTDWTKVRRGLEIGFVILAILLVILGLIIAFNKLRGGDEEKPEVNEGQTYY